MTQKMSDFVLFKYIIELMTAKEHLTMNGLLKIVSIKASMNKGLSENLVKAFPDLAPVKRPLIKVPDMIDPNWLAGFIDGEGCFYVKINKDNTKTGYTVSLNFIITQHSRDEQLIFSSANYLGCGNIQKDSKKPIVSLVV